jgi:hypothetical protein
VTVVNVRPINVVRYALPAGTALDFTLGGGGDTMPRRINYSLDQIDPVAMSNNANAGEAVVRFFSDQRISLNAKEKHTLTLIFGASATASEFDVEVEFEHKGDKYSKILHRTDKGAKFTLAPIFCENPVPLIGASRAEVVRVKGLQYHQVYKVTRDESRVDAYLKDNGPGNLLCTPFPR